MALRISNREARWLWLDAQGLAVTPVGRLDVMAIIRALGFVQLDTIQAVARAHHHIIWSRNQHYREPMLDRLLARDRAIFEHFTHDASILPIETFPYWQRQFRRLGEKTRKWEVSRAMPNAGERAEIRARIEAEGPLSTHDFDSKAPEKAMWVRPPHKMALDHMWYAGELATSHRDKFTKYYDLSERVIPDHHREAEFSDGEQLDWLCRSALDRLGFGSEGDIMRFWEAAALAEVRTWRAGVERELVPLEIECADRKISKAWGAPDLEARLATLSRPTTRLRILSPFDPAVRDRKRLARLFGYDFRIEIFVPAAERKWGYYVMPILEGDRFVGRIEAKADRKHGALKVHNVWPEHGVKWSAARCAKLDAELDRLGRFVGCSNVVWEEGARSD